MDAKPKLLDVVRDRIRAKHYSYRTEQQYLAWIRRFILYNEKRHPRERCVADEFPSVDGRLPFHTASLGASAYRRSTRES